LSAPFTFIWQNVLLTLALRGPLPCAPGHLSDPAQSPPGRRIAARTFICWEKTAAVAVKIKLKRLGRTRVPTYRIVVADARTKRDGRAIEEIGKYHPKEEPSLIEVNSERAQHWLSVGAQPTPPVMNILKITGDWQKFKGEPGAEGTLRTREPKADKKETFANALKDAGKDSGDSGSTTPRGGGRARKSDTKATDTKATDTKATDTKAEAKATDTKAAEAKADTDVKPESGRAKSKASSEKTAAGSADDSAAAAATADATATADAASPAASESSEPGSEA
jgi:small subunit ribosomal protein S16